MIRWFKMYRIVADNDVDDADTMYLKYGIFE